jgi:Kdo2-lipid IVA lauroyltransferase/acyltransferase
MPSENFKLAWLRYAIGWIGYGSMLAIVHLPLGWQLAIGKALGRASGGLLRSRRRVVERNLEACLPELSPERRAELVREHFAALGASIVEMSMGWFGSIDTIRARVRVEGEENLRAALERGKGVILSSAHFTSFEFFWPVLRALCPRLCGMYKWQRNPIMNKAMIRGRGRSYDKMFANDEVRGLLRSLAENSVVWYAADQSYAGKGSALLPFFGQLAMTNTATSRIARVSGATVLPCFCRRLPDDSGYVMSIGAPLQGLPSDDAAEDTRRLTALLEDYIRLCPDQYWWIHKRFKNRPPPLPDLYARPPT